jgi:hypothetical protein
MPAFALIGALGFVARVRRDVCGGIPIASVGTIGVLACNDVPTNLDEMNATDAATPVSKMIGDAAAGLRPR